MDSNSPVCLKSELDLFSATPVQLAIDSSNFVETRPITSLSESSPLEFFISGNGEQYLDLAHTILHLQLKILKSTNTDIATTDEVAPVNYVLNTLFSELSVFLNDKQISSQTNYAYRSLIEALVFSSKSSQDSMLTSSLFHKDDASKHDDRTTNSGFTKRKEAFKESKLVDLIGCLHFDLGAQPKLLPSGVDVRLKLERNKALFVLMALTDTFKISITSASLFVRKVNIAPSVFLAHEKALERGNMKIPIRRVEVRSFALSSGLQSTTITNAFIGQLPMRLILGFVSNEAYNGHIAKNPFNFHHYDVNYLCILEGGRMIPANPLQPNFALNLYSRSYLSLFTDLNRYHNNQNIPISLEDYKNGYSLFAFDLTPDFSAGEAHSSINKSGNISIDMKFNTALPHTVSLIVYAEYRNVIEIDKARTVFTDFQ